MATARATGLCIWFGRGNEDAKRIEVIGEVVRTGAADDRAAAWAVERHALSRFILSETFIVDCLWVVCRWYRWDDRRQKRC